MLAILWKSDEQETTCECRAGLAESRDPVARQAAGEWEERNLCEPEFGPWISMREMALRHQPQWLLTKWESSVSVLRPGRFLINSRRESQARPATGRT